MFDFLLDNPVFLFMAIYALYRFFKPKKPAQDAKSVQKANTQAADEALRRAHARVSAARKAPESMTLEQRLEALASDFESKMGGTSRSAPTAQAGSAPTAQAGSARAAFNAPRSTSLFSGPQSDEALSSDLTVLERHALARASTQPAIERGSLESGSLETTAGDRPAPQRTDFDLKADAFAYHTAIEEPDAKKFHLDSFGAYRSAVDEPATKQFHIDSFAGFHSATGARTATAQVESIVDERRLFDNMFGNTEDIQRAFVLTEILSRPLALRPRHSVYPR